MAIGDAVAKDTTYAEIEDIVRLRTGTIDDPKVSATLMLKEISLSIQKIVGILNGANAPFYLTTNPSLVITGSVNPYTIDVSAVSPYLDRIVKLVHVAGGVRTLVKMLGQEEVEQMSSLTTIYANSLFGVWEGDAIRLYKGGSFTLTPASDTTELKYYRQPKVSTVARSTKPDILDKYVPLVILDVVGKIAQYKNDGVIDSNIQTSIDKGVADIYREFLTTKQFEMVEKK